MLPKEKTPPRMDLSDYTVLAHGRPKSGKCVGGDTLVVDPVTARPVAIRDLVAGRSGSVLTMREGGVIAAQRPSAYLANEPAQLYRLTTQTGRTIEATANHPFLTRDGWKPLSDLAPSDRVAVVAEYPQDLGTASPCKIVFVQVASVEPTEVAPVYDLTVDGSHNFVANDFVVHNSTLCSHAPGALFLATEAGLNSLEVFQIPISTWDEFLKACGDVAAGGHGFKTVIVDTLDNAYRMCSEHVCAKHKIEHESDLGYGKGFALVNAEFYRVLNKLSLLPYGLFLISHSQEKETETRAGKRTRIVPTLPEKPRQMVLGMADIILFCDIETIVGPDGKPFERRVMRTKPSEMYEAGDRTGRLPDVLDLDYATFAAAFAACQGKQSPDTMVMEGARGSDGLLAHMPQPDSAAAAAPSTPSASEEKPRATDEQIAEFAGLVGELGISGATVKKRLAEYNATVVDNVARDDMESILAKLRAAKAAHQAEGLQEPQQ